MEGPSGSCNEGAGRGHTCSGETHCFRATNPFMGAELSGPKHLLSTPIPLHWKLNSKTNIEKTDYTKPQQI